MPGPYTPTTSSSRARGGLKALGLLEDSSASGNGIHADVFRATGAGLRRRLPTFVTAAAGLGPALRAHLVPKAAWKWTRRLAWLDDVIEDEAPVPVNRPQHLFLTGYEIYETHTSPPVCYRCSRARARPAGLRRDRATDLPTYRPDVAAFAHSKDLPAMRRARLVIEGAKFSTTDGSSHLLGVR